MELIYDKPFGVKVVENHPNYVLCTKDFPSNSLTVPLWQSQSDGLFFEVGPASTSPKCPLMTLSS